MYIDVQHGKHTRIHEEKLSFMGISKYYDRVENLSGKSTEKRKIHVVLEAILCKT